MNIREYDDGRKDLLSESTFIRDGCITENNFNEHMFSQKAQRTSYEGNQPSIYYDEFDFWPWAVISKLNFFKSFQSHAFHKQFIF